MIIEAFADGYVILADSTAIDTIQKVSELTGGDYALIIADPPYGNIVQETWDQYDGTDVSFATWMVEWTERWTLGLAPGGAFYVWGGIGKPGFRPFLRYLPLVEKAKSFELATLITWSKKRAYGVPNNYLFTREELAFFIKGDAKKPLVFNVPYLEKIRGYAGYNKKYPAKDARYRRTNVWTDITELFRNKVHPTQKPKATAEVIISVHTNPGDWVIDPFGGAGTTAYAARALGRKFVVIDLDETFFKETVARLKGELPLPKV
jgi:site-specific DNA-methyltransferase (adenine-specific)